MKATEYREKTDIELSELLQERQNDLMHYRLQKSTGVVDNVCSARETRKDVARIKTIMTERNRVAVSSESGKQEKT